VNDTKTLIRPACEGDREAVTRTFDAANPAWATSAAQYRLGPRRAPANGMELVADSDGRIVGAARVNEALEGLLPRPGTYSARVAVHPGELGQGIGGRLWNAIREWLEPQTPQEVLSWADHDDHRSVAVAAGWSFQRRSGSIEDPEDLNDGEPWAWNYELALPGGAPSVPGAPAATAGITLSPLAEVLDDPDLSASLHQAHEDCRSDVPAWEQYQPVPYADFARTQRSRLADGGIGLVAHRNGEVLAATFAERAAFVPMLHNDFTMVRRPARGQRLGVVVKNRLITEATAAGIERITTEVRTDNHPMQAINAALGFRRIAMRHLSRPGLAADI
jgi:GNAT superfamily N-acetyltransferase